MSYFIKKDKHGYDELNVKRVSLVSIGSILGVILLGIIFSNINVVDAGEVGIITRFGEVNRVQTSGLAVTIPFVEKLTEMEIRVQKEDATVAAATKDLQDVSSTLAINYALDNETALSVYKELGVDYKNRVLIPSIQETFKSVSAQYTASELITKRPEVKELVLSQITDRLEPYGIRVVDVNVTNFSFSVAFNEAIEAVQIANQNVSKAKQELETVKITAEKAITAAKGEAEAQRLQQSTLTAEMLQKYYIDKWNGVLPTTQAGDSSIISLPIK